MPGQWRPAVVVRHRKGDVLQAAKPHQIDHIIAARLDNRVPQPAPAHAVLDVLRDREMGKQCVVLEHQADIALVRAQPQNVSALHDDRAGCRLLKAREHAQCRGFAASARSEQSHAFAGMDVERNAVHGRSRAESFRDILDFDDGCQDHGHITADRCPVRRRGRDRRTMPARQRRTPSRQPGWWRPRQW